jgi:hypothetical protein
VNALAGRHRANFITHIGLPKDQESRFMSAQPALMTPERLPALPASATPPGSLTGIAFNRNHPDSREVWTLPNHRAVRAAGTLSWGGVASARGLARIYAAAIASSVAARCRSSSRYWCNRQQRVVAGRAKISTITMSKDSVDIVRPALARPCAEACATMIAATAPASGSSHRTGDRWTSREEMTATMISAVSSSTVCWLPVLVSAFAVAGPVTASASPAGARLGRDRDHGPDGVDRVTVDASGTRWPGDTDGKCHRFAVGRWLERAGTA